MAMTLAARDISFHYRPGHEVLKGVSFVLSPGTLVFLLGPNGCGKTTLIECLCGILRPTEGEVLLMGTPISRVPLRTRARLVAYVPQVHEPSFAYSVWEVVLMGRAPHLGLLGRPGPKDRRATAAALEQVGLAQLASRPYTTLSGGERRLALIARGLAQGAQLLLLDEPDAHLDPAYQHRILSALRELIQEGKGALASSHSPQSALLYADQVLLLHRGETLGHGPPEQGLNVRLLAQAYGVPFRKLCSSDGAQALVPCPETRRRNSSTERESAPSRRYSLASRAKASETAKGA